VTFHYAGDHQKWVGLVHGTGSAQARLGFFLKEDVYRVGEEQERSGSVERA